MSYILSVEGAWIVTEWWRSFTSDTTDADSHTDTQFNYYVFQTFTQDRGFNRSISLNLSGLSVPSPNKCVSHDIAGIQIAESEKKHK